MITYLGTSSLYSQSADRNYITTRTYTNDAGTTYLDQIEYFDDLGRPVQNVQMGITPSSKDLITLSEYTISGKDSIVWLPAIASGYNGAYIAPATIKSNAITSNADQNPYSKKTNDYATMSRSIIQFGPGQAWHNYNQREITNQVCNYGTGSTTPYSGIDLYIDGQSVKRRSDLPVANSYVSYFSKENGNWGTEHKNKKGQLIRSYTQNMGVAYNTYYVYDDYGNLRYVIPPKAAELLDSRTVITDSDTDAAGLIYVYRYDKRNRCIWKRLPGCEPIYYIYDKADQLIFTQDGEQRLRGEWSFSIPDALGRIVITGTCKNTINYAVEDPINVVVKAIPDLINTTYKYYSFNYNLTTPTVLTTNYYDNYDFIVKESFTKIPYDATQYNTRYGDETAANKYKHKGLLTGTMTALLDGSGIFLYKTMFYDQRKQLIQVHSTNHFSGGIEKEYIAYNFTGQPVKKKHIHSATGKTTQTEEYAYTYDHVGRLTKTTHKLNTGEETILSENTYDELGKLKTNKKGGNANLQSSYTYNVRSWIKTITSPLYEQTLYYNESYNGSSGRYGGDITAMEWQIQGENTKRAYTFGYDNISRLTAANYFVNGVTNTNYKITYSYDKHGNMLTLQRYGKTTASAYGLIDNLTMTYTGNQLTKAEDVIGTITLAESADFKNYSNAATEYTYNKNGSMAKDLNKGITQIQYNCLNLPTLMDIKSPVAEARNEYTYSAGGQKLKVVQEWNPNYSTAPVIGSAINTASLTQSKTTDYVGNKVYENGALKRVLVDGGYIEGGVYCFYLNDHLGNNRVVANSSGTVIQKNHYYPFGMAFAEGTVAEQGKQPYKYNGKELDAMHGLNLYDYSARYYESGIGRFTIVDPLAEKYYAHSPYAYAANNPILNIDPDGKDYWSTNDPEKIRGFLNSLQKGSFSSHDMSGWNHASDAEFLGRGTFNDETGKFHTSYASYEGGVVTVTGITIDAKILPVKKIGNENGQVRESMSGFWGFLGYHVLGIGSTHKDENGGVWNVSRNGYVTGLRPVMGMPPSVASTGSLSAAPRIINSLSVHSINQAVTRGFKTKDILDIVKTGTVNLRRSRFGNPQWHYSKNGNTVVVDATKNRVVTIFSNNPGTRNKLGAGTINP